MIRSIACRKVVVKPVVIICRVRGRGGRAASTSTSNTEGAAVASSPNIASAPGEDKRRSPEEPAERGVFPVKQQMQWKPSEAHRTSATALRREKAAESAHEKAGDTRPVNADGVLDTRRPAGLRRRALLGGASEAPPVQQQQTTTITSVQLVSGWPALLKTDSSESSSVASMSATQRFRQKRELERLAAAGSEEAVEALRALGSTFGSAATISSTGGGSEDGERGKVTPLSTGVPLLVALIAAGCAYFAVKGELVPPKWLSSIGDGSGFGGARSEGQRDFGDEEGESRASSEIALRSHGTRVDKQQREQRHQSQASRRPSPVSAEAVDAKAKAEAATARGSRANEVGPGRADGEGSRDRDEARQREPLWLRRLRYQEPPKSST